MDGAGVLVRFGSEAGRGGFGDSGGDELVVVMEPAKFRHLNHGTAVGGVDLTRLRAVHLQRPMSSPSIRGRSGDTNRAFASGFPFITMSRVAERNRTPPPSQNRT